MDNERCRRRDEKYSRLAREKRTSVELVRENERTNERISPSLSSARNDHLTTSLFIECCLVSFRRHDGMIVFITIVYFLTTTTTTTCSGENASIHSSQRLPQAIIIGVKKCGTRALLKFISTHSAVAASLTEIHFFDRTTNFQRGLDWYR